MPHNTLESPADLLRLQLRIARTMEDDSLAALHELAAAAQSSEVKQLFRHHADETKQQIQNLTRVFTLLGIPEATEPSPSTKGIAKQARSLIDRSVASLRDEVTLSAALSNEHYEIAAYESLLVAVRATGQHDALGPLQENLDQETRTTHELRTRLQSMR